MFLSAHFFHFYLIFQHDSGCAELFQNPSGYYQPPESAHSVDPSHHYEDQHPYQPQQYPQDKDLALPNDYAHIHSDLDFSRFPFVNQEYFTGMEAVNEISSDPPVHSTSFLSEDIATIINSSSASSGNHKNIVGSVLHFYNKE